MSKTVFVDDIAIKTYPNGKPQIGKIKSILARLFKETNISVYTRENNGGKISAYAFVNFNRHKRAVRAIRDHNYYKINGVPIRLSLADKKSKEIIEKDEGNIFIKNLSPDFETKDLDELFSQFGEIISCKVPFYVIKIPTKIDSNECETKTVSRGYGYVQFRHKKDAIQAMKVMNNQIVFDHKIEVQPYIKKSKRDPNDTFTNCYIKNLPDDIKTDDDLKELFAEFGTPVSCKLVVGKHFGFCSMSTHEEAINAIEGLNGREINGILLFVSRQIPKEERKRELQEISDKYKQSNHEKYKGRNLFVKNFDEDVTEDDLKSVFSQFGEIESATIKRNQEGKSLHYGFVCFKSVKSAKKCLKNASRILIHGQNCYVNLLIPKKQLSTMAQNHIKLNDQVKYYTSSSSSSFAQYMNKKSKESDDDEEGKGSNAIDSNHIDDDDDDDDYGDELSETDDDDNDDKNRQKYDDDDFDDDDDDDDYDDNNDDDDFDF